MQDKIKKIAVEFCRILVGALFVFSGFVKAIDPLGSAYKFHDYFNAFGMPWMDPFTLPMSFCLSAFEFSLGVLLLFGTYRNLTSFLVLAFMLFMTPLTLYLAIANPVSDCGCFGDALIITNWETFFKNIILLSAAVIIFLWRKKITPVYTHKLNWLSVLYTYIFIFGVSFYCYLNLPILDFRPYKIGADIPELTRIPEDAKHDKFETTFIYEKDGVEKEFSLENYPANDSTWKFVDSKTKLIEKGYIPPIHDFSITMQNGSEITDIVLSDTAYTFLLISQQFYKANDSDIDKINEVFDYAQMHDYGFYCLTASSSESISEWIEDMGAEYPICITDETTLKTIIRSNPGLLLLKSGTIINKWHHRNIPKDEELNLPLGKSQLGKIPPNTDKQKIMYSALFLIGPLLLIYIFDYFIYRRKKTPITP